MSDCNSIDHFTAKGLNHLDQNALRSAGLSQGISAPCHGHPGRACLSARQQQDGQLCSLINCVLTGRIAPILLGAVFIHWAHPLPTLLYALVLPVNRTLSRIALITPRLSPLTISLSLNPLERHPAQWTPNTSGQVLLHSASEAGHPHRDRQTPAAPNILPLRAVFSAVGFCPARACKSSLTNRSGRAFNWP